MKKQDFLKKIKTEGKLELIEPSEDIKQSYLKKAENCFKSAKILRENGLYENSISEAYYCMYDSLLALLYRIGIKSENHSASIIILEELFDKELAEMMRRAKAERIDKQYYVETQSNTQVNEQSCKEMLENAEKTIIKIKLIISKINKESIIKAKKLFENLF